MNPKPRSRDERDDSRPFKGAHRKESGDRGRVASRGRSRRALRASAPSGGRPTAAAQERPAPEKPVEALLPTKVQTVKVTADENNMRVDRFLEARFPRPVVLPHPARRPQR
ncbi:hypothetical protein BRDID11002_74030 [Bradyrhizobium diazoefficiens]